MNPAALSHTLKDHGRYKPRTFMRARAMPLAREIALRARVEFTQFGVTLAARVVGISHDDPMRYDLKLEDGAIVSNVPEPAIGALTAPPKPIVLDLACNALRECGSANRMPVERTPNPVVSIRSLSRS
jgi:hypothetical protein